MSEPYDTERAETETRRAWLEGYEWALTHLTDPGVLADARGLAFQREQAETAQEDSLLPGVTSAPSPLDELRRERDELARRNERQAVRIAQCQELHLSSAPPVRQTNGEEKR